MSTPFYRGTKSNVKNKIARLLIAPSTYNIPVQLSEIINLTTYNPNSTYGFEDMGYTLEPVALSVTTEQAAFTVEQEGEIKSHPTEQRHVVRTVLAEVTMANRSKLFASDAAEAVSGASPAENRMRISRPKSLPTYRLAVVSLDEELDKISGVIYPKVQASASAMEESWSRADATRLAAEFNAYPNDDNFNDAEGNPVIRIDLEQA